MGATARLLLSRDLQVYRANSAKELEQYEADINCMLYAADDACSCFYDETRLTGRLGPTLASLFDGGREVAVYVAMYGHRVVGIVTVDVIQGMMHSFCVDKSVRGQRIGTRILEEVCSQHPNLSLTIYAHPEVANHAAWLFNFYARHGFRPGPKHGHFIHMTRRH